MEKHNHGMYVLSVLEEKMFGCFFKSISCNMSSELLGVVPHPNLLYAIAVDVRHTQLFFCFASVPQLIGKMLD